MGEIPQFDKRAHRHLFTLEKPTYDRVPAMSVIFALICVGIMTRLFFLQVVQAPYYQAIAQGQRGLSEQLLPKRGQVYVRDVNTNEEYPLATNQELEFVYAVPRDIDDVDETIKKIADPLKLSKTEQKDLKERLQDKEDLYEPVKRKVSPVVWEKIEKMELEGIEATPEQWRIYPEGSLAASVIGYVGFIEDDLVGQYGIEGFYNKELSGNTGQINSEIDSSGRRIIAADNKIEPAKDGVDILLTLDRTIQHLSQEKIIEGVQKYMADYGEIIVMDPKTGDILAMATAPTFDPNKYQEIKDLSVFKNSAIFDSYEPGSTFKPLIMAAAIDLDLVTPDSVFVDNGCRQVDVYKICNYDNSGPGSLTATGALERSSNVVMSQISEKVGRDNLYKYLKKFGFDSLMGINLDSEAEISLPKPGGWSDSQLATLGFGQGIAITPLHLISAMSALANEGKMMQPHIVKEIRQPDGEIEQIKPKVAEEVVRSSTAQSLSAMLVSAIENGVASAARLDEYTVAGKTGTAQVADASGTYNSGKWVASFIGYGPIPDSEVIILIRLYNPKTSMHGANTAAPMFSELAPQILHYLRIPADRGE